MIALKYTINYLISSFLLIISTCFTAANALDDFDLYKYGNDEKIKIERKSFIVKFVLYDNEMDLNDAYYANRERPEGEGVRAFAMSTKEADVCYVHIKPAKIWDDREGMAIMGHEIYHCALAKHRTATFMNTEQADILDAEDEGMEDDIEGFITKREFINGLRYRRTFNEVKLPADDNQSKKKKEKTREELLAEDRALELEWLKEDYKKMGVVIDE